MKRTARFTLPGLIVLFTPAVLLAHPGHAGHSLAGGFQHPFTGLDHILALLAVGLWSQQLVGRAKWRVPLGFLALMILGGALAPLNLPTSPIEIGILVSVLALGMILMLSLKMPIPTAAALAGAFAVFHGYAHLAEMSVGGTVLPYASGFVLASAILLGIGMMIGRLLIISRQPQWLRVCGAAIVVMGLLLALG